jgi:hypothetical protein
MIGNRKGSTLIIAIFIIVILAFMGVMFVSLINTSTFSSINNLQSMQALSVAEGGAEYEQLNLANNLDWYRSATDPLAAPTPHSLGTGSFTVTSNLPATKLRAQVPATGTNPLRVYTTDRFLSSGCILIDDEFIQYTGLGATNAICGGRPPCFTNITRVAPACGGGTQAAHSRGDAVYPVSTTSTNLPNNCNDMAALIMTDNTKFLTAGTLDIQGEEVSYSGSSRSGGNLTLTGIQRCQGGTPTSGNNLPATPILSSDQAEVISMGTVGAAARTVKKTVQR